VHNVYVAYACAYACTSHALIMHSNRLVDALPHQGAQEHGELFNYAYAISTAAVAAGAFPGRLGSVLAFHVPPSEE
jgi:hypothetical protein